MIAVLLGLAGIGVAWWIYGAERPAPGRAAQTLLEHKFYFDELYDRLFYRPAVCLATASAAGRAAARASARCASWCGGAELGLGTGRLQTGLVRTYALAIAASLAVVTVVFVAVR